MAEAGASGFLREAAQGKIAHNVTASAAAAAMNAVKPAVRQHDAGASGGGDSGYDYQNRYDSGGAASMGMLSSQRGGEEPMKINLGVGSEANGGMQNSPVEEQGNWMDAQAQQMQAQQAAMFAQMQMSNMYNPYAQMAPMGFSPWGWPPMDPSMMMGKGMPYPNMGMYGLPQASPGMPASTGKGKKGGGASERKAKPTEQKKKGKPKAAPPDTAEVEDTEEAAANRSELLNEVRRSHQKSTASRHTWEEVMPHLLEFAKDQHGSRYLQLKLDESSEGERTVVFQGLLPEARSLAGDAFGNFVVQKLFDVCMVEQKKELAEKLEGKVLQLGNEMHGCRVLQKALQVLPREAQQRLAKELEGHVGTCIENMHGNHVIQKCIEQMPPDSVTFIINEVSQKVEFWATHGYGCRVIQRLLEHCTASQLPKMLDQLLGPVSKLAKDSYGNYVVQHMLEHGRCEDKAAIIGVLSKDIVEYSKNKCSSNVVEKCFEITSVGEHANQLEQERQQLYMAVIGDVRNPNSPLLAMMDDRFGNYIVQRMIEYSKGDDRIMLQNKLLSVEPILKNSNSGKHILNALHKEFGS
jgi:pumilio RNA-binding family